MRTDFDPLFLVTLAEQMYMTYLTSVPLYQAIAQGEDASSPETLTHVQDILIEFIVHRLINDTR